MKKMTNIVPNIVKWKQNITSLSKILLLFIIIFWHIIIESNNMG